MKHRGWAWIGAAAIAFPWLFLALAVLALVGCSSSQAIRVEPRQGTGRTIERIPSLGPCTVEGHLDINCPPRA